MTGVTTVLQRRDELRRAFGQNDIAIQDDGVTGKMDRFFLGHVDQISEMIANGALAVFIEGGGKPEGAAIRQRAKTGIDVIKPRVDQLD